MQNLPLPDELVALACRRLLGGNSRITRPQGVAARYLERLAGLGQRTVTLTIDDGVGWLLAGRRRIALPVTFGTAATATPPTILDALHVWTRQEVRPASSVPPPLETV